MSSIAIFLIAFACAFSGALVGMFLRTVLPEHHLSDKTRDAVKVGTGLIATLTALVLGLLVSSAKSSFDAINTELTQTGAQIILLDRVLAQYGPETNEARELMRRNVISVMEMIWPEDKAGHVRLSDAEKSTGGERVVNKLRELSPKNESQRLLQSQALQIAGELAQARWMLVEQTQSSLPIPFLVVLIFWLTVFFACFGLFSERNATVITIMLICSLSVAGAIYLIEEMNHPFEGLIKVSSAPLRKALDHLGK